MEDVEFSGKDLFTEHFKSLIHFQTNTIVLVIIRIRASDVRKSVSSRDFWKSRKIVQILQE